MFKRFRIGALCLLVMMLAACGTQSTPTFTKVPTSTHTPAPAITIAPTLHATATYTRTPYPTLTPSITGPTPTLDPDVTATPDSAARALVEAQEQAEPPPLSLEVPEDWQGRADVRFDVPIAGGVVPATFSIWHGPLPGGIHGQIIIIHHIFRVAPTLWGSATGFLRFSVFESTCQFVLGEERAFDVGGVPGTGTEFQVSDCVGTPDAIGWFAAVTVDEMDMIFYAIAETGSYEDADALFDQLQAILSSVTFENQTE